MPIPRYYSPWVHSRPVNRALLGCDDDGERLVRFFSSAGHDNASGSTYEVNTPSALSWPGVEARLVLAAVDCDGWLSGLFGFPLFGKCGNEACDRRIKVLMKLKHTAMSSLSHANQPGGRDCPRHVFACFRQTGGIMLGGIRTRICDSYVRISTTHKVNRAGKSVAKLALDDRIRGWGTHATANDGRTTIASDKPDPSSGRKRRVGPNRPNMAHFFG